MLQIINHLPSNVVGVRATGEVTREDMEQVLLPAISQLAERENKINYLLVLDTGVQNFTLAAWWNDLKLGLKNFTKWNRIAVVSEQKGVEWFTDLFRFAIPGKSKGFTHEQLAESTVWVSDSSD